MDDAYLGGEKPVKPGRDATGKTPFLAAVQRTSQGLPEATKLQIVDGFLSKTIKVLAKQFFAQGSKVISDGLACFHGVTDAGYQHNRKVCGGGRAFVEEPEFYWVNTPLGHLKSALRAPTILSSQSLLSVICLSVNIVLTDDMI